MPNPTKIPTQFAFIVLNETNRGYRNPEAVDMHDVQALCDGENSLVRVAKLRRFFANAVTYKMFKEGLLVDDNAWNAVVQSTENDAVRKYAKRFMTRRPRKRKNRHVSRLGTYSNAELSDDELSDASAISITPSNDECDDTDVNLPLPVCAGIRRVCRNYDAQRRYIPYVRDASDNKRYHLKVAYA